MTNLEKALKRQLFVVQALAFVQNAAAQDRKLSDRPNGHYTEALTALSKIVDHETALVTRLELGND